MMHTQHRGRRIRTVAAIAATVVAVTTALAGCSSDTGSDNKTVTFLSWDGAQTMKPLIAGFEKEHPEYTVKISYATPVAPYIQKLQTQIGSNTAPDVFIITAENKHQIIANNAALDLSDQSWTSNLGTAERETYSKDGKLYGAATSSWGGGLLVNKKLLEQAGITEFPTTWSSFLSMCKKLKAAGIQPYMESGDGISVTLAALIGQQNEKLDGKMDDQIWSDKTTFEKSWTPAVKAWHELYSEGIVPTTTAGLTGDQVSEQFEQGKVAMMGTGSWALAGIQEAAPDLDLGFEAVPGIDGSPYWAGAVSPGYAVNAKAKNKEGGLAFVEYLQSKEAVKVFQEETASITTTKDYTPKLDAALTSMTSDVRSGKFYLPAVSWLSNNDVLSSEATALFQQTISGTITPKQFGAQMDQKLASVK